MGGDNNSNHSSGLEISSLSQWFKFIVTVVVIIGITSLSSGETGCIRNGNRASDEKEVADAKSTLECQSPRRSKRRSVEGWRINGYPCVSASL